MCSVNVPRHNESSNSRLPGIFLIMLMSLILLLPTTTTGFSPTTSGNLSIRHPRQQHEKYFQLLTASAKSDKNDEPDETWLMDDDDDELSKVETKRRGLLYDAIALGLIGASGVASLSLFQTNVYTPDGFTRIPTQFIAALGDPKASAGTSAKDWGVWALDPGPRGVWLRDYSQELATLNDRRAPAGWTFNPNDWWLEEHGLIMEEPYFPLLAGRYLVTGGRLVTTGLTISENGSWRLDDGTLYDVTHLPCRSARYTPLENSATIGSPLTANPTDFPVAPGAIMPSVTGCQKQDYAVLFVVGKESPNKA